MRKRALQHGEPPLILACVRVGISAVRARARLRVRVRVRVRLRVRVRVRVRSATPDWERVGHDGLKAGRMLSCERTCVGAGHGWGQG